MLLESTVSKSCKHGDSGTGRYSYMYMYIVYGKLNKVRLEAPDSSIHSISSDIHTIVLLHKGYALEKCFSY